MEFLHTFCCIEVTGICIIYANIVIGKKFRPDHSLALSAWLRKEAFLTAELTEEDMLHFFRREELSCVGALHEGVNLLLYEGQPIGFTKRIGARTNSLLPKELRILSQQ